MNAIEKFDSEIAQLQAAITAVEAAPPTIAERYAVAERELREAEAVFRRYGPKVTAGHPEQAAYLQRQAQLGACMVVGAPALLKAERDRVEQQGEGLSAADKARRLDELRRQILRTSARRELALRDIEGADFMPRPVHPELVASRRADIERLAR